MAAPFPNQLIVPSGSTITILGRADGSAILARLNDPKGNPLITATLAEVVRLVNAAEIDGYGPPAPKSAWEALAPLLRG